jgi:hypothetical protein
VLEQVWARLVREAIHGSTSTLGVRRRSRSVLGAPALIVASASVDGVRLRDVSAG